MCFVCHCDASEESFRFPTSLLCSSFYFHFYLHIHFYISSSSSSWYWMLYSAWHVIQIKFILCTHFFLWHLVVCSSSPSRKSNSLIYIFKWWWKTIKAYFFVFIFLISYNLMRWKITASKSTYTSLMLP